MKILLGILLILLLLVIWLLITPIIITLSTRLGLYELRLFSLGRVRVSLQDEILILHTRILFYRRNIQFDLLAPREKKKARATRKKEKAPKEKEEAGWEEKWERAKLIMRSFRLRELDWSLDTGNPYYNGLLFPALAMFSQDKRQMSINFVGRNEFHLVLSNNIFKLLYATYIQSTKK